MMHAYIYYGTCFKAGRQAGRQGVHSFVHLWIQYNLCFFSFLFPPVFTYQSKRVEQRRAGSGSERASFRPWWGSGRAGRVGPRWGDIAINCVSFPPPTTILLLFFIFFYGRKRKILHLMLRLHTMSYVSCDIRQYRSAGVSLPFLSFLS